MGRQGVSIFICTLNCSRRRDYFDSEPKELILNRDTADPVSGEEYGQANPEMVSSVKAVGV